MSGVHIYRLTPCDAPSQPPSAVCPSPHPRTESTHRKPALSRCSPGYMAYAVTSGVPVRHTVGSLKAPEKDTWKSNATSSSLTLSLHKIQSQFLLRSLCIWLHLLGGKLLLKTASESISPTVHFRTGSGSHKAKQSLGGSDSIHTARTCLSDPCGGPRHTHTPGRSDQNSFPFTKVEVE